MLSTTPGAVTRPIHNPTIWVSAAAVLVAQMCLTVLAPLNDVIQSTYGASATQLTWLTAAVFAPTALLELNFGVLGDMFGRKKLMQIGLGFVAIGAVVGIFADSLLMLAIALVILGLGAATLLPSTLASAAEFSPNAESRAHALSRWAIAISIGAAVSPLLSAIMVQQTGLGGAFSPVLVAAVIAFVLVTRFAQESRSAQKRAFDVPGQILIIVGLLAFIFAIIHGSEAGFGSPEVIISLAVAIVALVVFAWVEFRSKNPMFQVRLFKIPAFAAAAAVGLLGMLSFMGTAYAMAIKLGPIAHAAPLMVALPFVLIQLVPLVLARWLPGLIHRISPRTLLVFGLVILAIGQVWLAVLADGTTDLLALAVPILLLGVGFIVMFTSLTAAAVNSVSHEHIGMASGATSLVRETGQTLGPAVVAAVALGSASAATANGLNSADLPAEVAGVANEVFTQGGPLAVANAPLPEAIHDAVAPIATAALEHGFDLGLLTMAGLSIISALIVLIVMRGSAATTPLSADETDLAEHHTSAAAQSTTEEKSA
ncbi:MFS transporter [Microbacterium sp. CH12i]|uniref:MFS transporter n=1 Tax=Microbacterium sp. CH12i TaxID=1479651 RepID=UPI000460E343|nr:MFS transporter [Microbacterium sp. CH12i]KDA05008.1 MFS transporter [Microbacterium sp. CH12i]